MSQKITENEALGEVHRAFCHQCQQATEQKVIASVDDEREVSDGSATLNESFQIVQCLGCEQFSFRHQTSSSDEVDADGHREVRESLYPSPRRLRGSLPDAYLLPYRVKDIYLETFAALNSDQPVLAGVGIRALVEVVCKDRNVTGTLAQKIDQLIDLDLLRQSEADLLRKARFMGDAAVYEMKPSKRDGLEAAFDIAEQLLDTVYLRDKRAENLPSLKFAKASIKKRRR